MYTTTEAVSLFTYLAQHKYHNLHTRKNKQVNKKTVTKYLHGMKLSDENIVSGYYCGPLASSKNLEINYEIDRKGTIKVKTCIGVTKTLALDYIEKEKKEVMKRVRQGLITFSPKYKKGQFYLRRSSMRTPSAAASKAVLKSILTDKFVATMASWNLCVIEGRNT